MLITLQVYDFSHATTKKAIKAVKSAQLHKNSSNNSGEARIGDSYIYTADDKKYRIEVTDRCRGDGRYHVPRCVAGKNGSEKVDLDTTNGKLLVRKFSKIGSGQKKNLQPAFITSQAAELNAMKQPLRFWKDDSGSWEVQMVREGLFGVDYLIKAALKHGGPEAAAEVTTESGNMRITLNGPRPVEEVPAAAVATLAAGSDVAAAKDAAEVEAAVAVEEPMAATETAEAADVPAELDQAAKITAATAATAAASIGDNSKAVKKAAGAGSSKGTLLAWLGKQSAQ